MREMLDIFALLALVGYSGFIVYLAYHYIKNKFFSKDQ